MPETNFADLRQKMVDCQIRTTDVTELRLLDALLSIPREVFVPKQKRDLAYIDEDIEILSADDDHSARYLMEPSPLAKLIQLAAIKETDVVLEVGCGTGYASAVMSRLASSVIALDDQPALIERASETLAELGCDNVVTVEGRNPDGYASEAPYDVIFINGAVDEVPEALFAQIRNGGRLVTVVGTGNNGVAMLYVKDEDGIVSGRRAFNAAVKMLDGFEKSAEFTF